MITLDLTLDYPDENTANAIVSALGPDNEGYVESSVQGNTIHFRIVSEKSGTVKNTADDLMACIKVAEEMVGVTHM